MTLAPRQGHFNRHGLHPAPRPRPGSSHPESSGAPGATTTSAHRKTRARLFGPTLRQPAPKPAHATTSDARLTTTSRRPHRRPRQPQSPRLHRAPRPPNARAGIHSVVSELLLLDQWPQRNHLFSRQPQRPRPTEVSWSSTAATPTGSTRVATIASSGRKTPCADSSGTTCSTGKARRPEPDQSAKPPNPRDPEAGDGQPRRAQRPHAMTPLAPHHLSTGSICRSHS